MKFTLVPKKRMVLGCDFRDFKAPEITKERPVVIMACSPARPRLCTVVPLSRTPPEEMQPWHHPLTRASCWDRQKRWAKCDMIYTVAFDRIDRWMKGKDRQGKRQFLSNFYVSEADFQAMQACMAAALNLKLSVN